ncbi:hypothetical protein ERJ75_000359100 [Trypanosoma vivax]|nr:hypothetical protein ERJ75_000359100 [Trypanosoma vivax]
MTILRGVLRPVLLHCQSAATSNVLFARLASTLGVAVPAQEAGEPPNANPSSSARTGNEALTVSAERPKGLPNKSRFISVAETLSLMATKLQMELNNEVKDGNQHSPAAVAAATQSGSSVVVGPGLVASETSVSPVRLISALRGYIRSEELLDTLCRSRVASVRRHYALIRAQRRRLSTVQRNLILREITRVVEKREVPLAIVVRLLRPRWPNCIMDVTVSRQHAFLRASVRAWIAELLKEGKLSPRDARLVLAQCPRLFHGQVSLMGSAVECALSDQVVQQDAELLIQLMWSVNMAGTHAPHRFWQRVVGSLAELNRSLRGTLGNSLKADGGIGGGSKAVHGGTENDKEAVGSKRNAEKVAGMAVGHVFSGLTTRQLFRALRVLRKERWCGDVTAVYDFVDKALKNIVFEVEAAGAAGNKKNDGKISRQAVLRRIRKTSDLSPHELLSLLSIAGEIGMEFHPSLARVSEYLLAPMVTYLNREQLLLLTACVRQTRCESPYLVQVIADEIVHRGARYPCSMSLSKAAVRTVLQKPLLLSQLTLTPLINHVLTLCETYRWCMRASQLLSWAELLYDLSRRYAPSSSVGTNVRVCVNALAAPLRVMLAAGVVPNSILSRFLEHTIILGMRAKKELYVESTKLWEERNAAVNERIEHAKKLFPNEKVPPLLFDDELEPIRDAENGDELYATPKNGIESNPQPSARELSRAARKVYDDIIYVYERSVLMREPVSKEEVKRVNETFGRVGLYSLFVGAGAVNRVHFSPQAATLPQCAPAQGGAQAVSKDALPLAFRTLPPWLERRVCLIVQSRLQDSNVSPASSDDQVLRVLGQRRCSEAKVRHLVHLITQESPFILLRQQRMLWEYIVELARRFGDTETQQIASEALKGAFY